jgi:hypothetical protein
MYSQASERERFPLALTGKVTLATRDTTFVEAMRMGQANAVATLQNMYGQVRHSVSLLKNQGFVWTGGRVVEGARLESVYRGNSIAGSNPALSAMI